MSLRSYRQCGFRSQRSTEVMFIWSKEIPSFGQSNSDALAGSKTLGRVWPKALVNYHLAFNPDSN